MPGRLHLISLRLLAAAAFAANLPAPAQVTVLTVADYARAEKMMNYNTAPLVFHSGLRATWTGDDRFWYRDVGPDGSRFVMVTAANGTKAPAFDHEKLAAALSAAAGETYDALHLPFTTIEFSDDRQSMTFALTGAEAGAAPPAAARPNARRPRRFRCDVQGTSCKAEAGPGNEGPRGMRGGRNDVPSPDKTKTAFLRDYNLWVRDVASGKETQLTTDGVKDFGYATDNAGWTKSDRPILLWSPDSKRIATFQQDQRGVGEMYLVDTKVGHPTLQAWKYPLPGDKVVAMIHRVVIEVDQPKVVRLKMAPDQHRSSLCDDIACRAGEWADVEWSPDSRQLAFVSTSRDHKQENLRVAHAESGEIGEVLEEKVDTFFESGAGRVNWRYLRGSNEMIWFSERDNWGHLYLYDLATGRLKNQITKGEGNVTQLLRVDEKNRLLYFLGVGMEKGRDPYFTHFYRIGYDGKGLKLLTPEEANHEITLSPDGTYFFDSFSKPDVAPVAVLRDSNGKLIETLEKADISKLVATGWKPTIPITVKARDGATDLYGLMYRPTNFDPKKKYPIVNQIYPGPQGGSVGSRSFQPTRGDTQALAELGFIVVQIDGMGNPSRSKKFHEFYYANMGDNTLPDQIAGMKELAAKYPWIDIDKAGIWGHSGGGFATADAMFRYPDFFKVGISEAGNHDNRVYEDDWAEKWHGLLVTNPDGTTNYDDQANQNHAKNLKGHLLLAHGTMDSNVPPNNTLLVVDALIKANKDFDLLMLPNRGHGFASEPYMIRRRWDYFVKWLMGAEPPKEYELHPPAAGRGFGPPVMSGASEQEEQ
ncbi:DPP IV N-terminal domain-containing protein [uncultured Paludibaculum sp.]|uniref:S9 family peptidase n=1 Tax=uncultured Paludibaculum sp. TaxID=1765020 RepID=UPI002AAABBFC|nr:DPP IV N-terminal domain-containing protein [uncultured Paludibaculum sp.]